MKDWACKSIGEVVNERDAALERCDEMREALERARFDFTALLARGDFADDDMPRAKATLAIIETALKGNQ